VLFTQGIGCPIVRKNIVPLKEVRAKFASRGVDFWMINASPQDDLDEIATEAKDWGIDFPILKDEARLVASALELVRTAEALVIDTKTWSIVYRGPLDDRLDYETERPVRERHLEDALNGLLAGEPIGKPRVEPRGCLIRHRQSVVEPPPSYAHEIAPILADRCRTCHRAGGVAPWQMTDYATVHGWAPMMREVLRTGRMPPWRNDPRFGHFVDDGSLSSQDRGTLVRWIEAGAPRGDGPDPLVTDPAPPAPEWQLGEPDFVVEVPEQQIPATGVLPYRYERLTFEFETDRWIRAAEIRPSNAAVMHHTIVWINYRRANRRFPIEGPDRTRGQFAAYVPGIGPANFPEGSGFRLPARGKLKFQIHYISTGRPEVDRPQLGLYFAKGPVTHELHVGAVVNEVFRIPPRDPEYDVRATHTFEKDVLVYSFSPHMHYRGKHIRYELETPDGRRETLLSVPRYDFNWQHSYVLETPIAIRAGSRLHLIAGFDNSPQNPANPDPDRWVTWGKQSFDEMLLGYFLYRERHESEPAATWLERSDHDSETRTAHRPHQHEQAHRDQRGAMPSEARSD